MLLYVSRPVPSEVRQLESLFASLITLFFNLSTCRYSMQLLLACLATVSAFPPTPEDEQIYGPPKLLNCRTSVGCCRKKFHIWRPAAHEPDAVIYSADHIISVSVRRYDPKNFAGLLVPEDDASGIAQSSQDESMVPTQDTSELEIAIFFCYQRSRRIDDETRIRGPYLMDCSLFGPNFKLKLPDRGRKHEGRTASCEEDESIPMSVAYHIVPGISDVSPYAVGAQSHCLETTSATGSTID